MTKIIIALACMLSLNLAACHSTAQTKKKKNTTMASVIESHKHTILPGRPEGDMVIEYAISITWNSTKTPIAFWWRGDNGWMTCRVALYPGKGKATPNTEGSISLEEIKKGQKITLIPMPGGKYAIPSIVGNSVTNTLYYQVEEGKYIPLKIATFTYNKKIAMP